jgi:hypothetical protein
MFLSHASQRTSSLGAQITMSIARSHSDLEDAFGLVYRSYVRAGLDSPNPTGLRLTKFHFLPTTDVILARNAGVPIATASLFVDGDLGLPAESMYGAEIQQLKDRGMRLAEVGSLADRRESPARFIQMFRVLSTLISQAAQQRGCNGLIAATHPRHARFYIKQIGFEPFGEIRACPYAQGNPAVAMVLDFEDHRRRDTDIYHHLFGLPFTAEELEPYAWSDETHGYFQGVLDRMSDSERSTPLLSAAPTTLSTADAPAAPVI